MSTLRPGKYRHYKGKEYEVIGVARHSETEESLAVYRQLYGEGGLWVRPLGMFEERLLIDGKSVQRFTFLQGVEPMDEGEQTDPAKLKS
jgi:hypothetical protein